MHLSAHSADSPLSCAIFAVGEMWGFDLAVKEAIRLRIELEATQDAMHDPLKQ